MLEKATNVVGQPMSRSDDSNVIRMRSKDSLNAASLESLKEFLGNNQSGKTGIGALEKIM